MTEKCQFAPVVHWTHDDLHISSTGEHLSMVASAGKAKASHTPDGCETAGLPKNHRKQVVLGENQDSASFRMSP